MNDTAVRYFIKKPRKGRKTFGLVKFCRSGVKKIYQELDPSIQKEVDLINEQLRLRALTSGQAETLLKEIIEREYRKQGRGLRSAQLLGLNQKVFERFWQDVYSIRYLEDSDSPKYETLKALRMIEPLSIQTASQSALQERLRASGSISEVRRATTKLNQILRYLKRDFKLNKPKPQLKKVQYLTYEEFQRILRYMDGDMSNLAIVLFASGLRLGEALALEPEDYRNGEVNVTKQIDKQGNIKLPKAEKTGRSAVLPFGHKAMLAWVECAKRPLRDQIYTAIVSACQKAFPNRTDKWCSPHDLRHSHAIHLLGLGANLSQVALNLRNRIDVCQMYYTGFAHSEQSLEYLKKLLR